MRLLRCQAAIALLIVTPAVLVPATSAETVRPLANWRALRTPNFYLLGDAGDRGLRDVARQLEQFREALGLIFPNAVATARGVPTVFVFRSQKSYSPFKPQYQGKPVEHVAGHFQGARGQHYIALTTEQGADGFGLIFHEYTHLVMNSAMRGLPAWFNEGLAEYYSTFQTTAGGRGAVLGRVDANHVLLLREQFLPLETLVAVDHTSSLYNERDKASIFYAQSWALVHYLLVGEQRKHARATSDLVVALMDGEPFASACQRTLGMSVAELERKLKQYVGQELFQSLNAKLAEKLASHSSLAPAPVGEAEAHAAVGDMLIHMNRAADARAHLEHALAVDPEYGPAHASLGLLHLDAGEIAEARARFERAAAGKGTTARNHYFHAAALDRGDGVDANAVIAALRRCLEIDPQYADALARLAWHRSRQDDGAAEAVAAAERAVQLEPGRDEFALTLASALASARQYARAKQLAASLQRSATVGKAAGEMLSWIAKREEFDIVTRQRASAPPSPGAAAPPAAGPRTKPVLRRMLPGESRLSGRLISIACGAGGIVFEVADDGGGTVKARASALDQVELITYREDLAGQVRCGPRATPEHILLTFRSDETARGDVVGSATAIEFLPNQD